MRREGAPLLGEVFGLPDEKDQGFLRNSVKSWGSDVWLNFTHFVEVDTDIDKLTPEFLCQLWTRTCAVQYKVSQPVMDGFFVGYEGDIKEPVILTSFVLIPYQIKAGSTMTSKCAADGLTCPFIIQSNGMLFKPRHVALFLDLATPSEHQATCGLHSTLTFGKANTKGCKWDGYAEGEGEVERYCLSVRGHNKAQYPVINGFEHTFGVMFQRVLACSQPEFQKHVDGLRAVTRVIKAD